MSGDEDLGVLAGRLLSAVQGELFRRLHDKGFDDIVPRHGAVLAYLRHDGIRATELAGLSGQIKQVIGVMVDDLETLGYVERRPDPADRRAKLVVPTDRGREQMSAAASIMADAMNRRARDLGAQEFRRFLADFRIVIERQYAAIRVVVSDPGSTARVVLDK